MTEVADVVEIPRVEAWGEQNRSVSDASLSSSREQLALVGFANSLYTVSTGNDDSIADETDVRNEAKLLMSLSAVDPKFTDETSGRITPPSDISSCGSRARDAFTFSCPSLSLENFAEESGTQASINSSEPPSQSIEGLPNSIPSALLGRVLKVDDRDALRLSSEAMARNIMQSYNKAIQWRVESWIRSLSQVLVDKEKELKEEGMATEENLKLLCESSEALLILQLREISEKVRATHASTKFNVLPHRLPKEDDEAEKRAKRQRLSEQGGWREAGLEESEYEYSVAHVLALECDISVTAPGVGNISIDLQVPGTMKGTFLSVEDGNEQLVDVTIDVDTGILASMIEKSSRTAVRASVEALLQGEVAEEQDSTEAGSVVEVAPTTVDHVAPIHSEEAHPSTSPKRRISDASMSGTAVVTPREYSSPVEFVDGVKGIIPAFPDNLESEHKGFSGLATRLPQMKKRSKQLPNVITPSKSARPILVGKGPGPDLPTLVEVALQFHTD
eukprot:Nitzschia sp. Nitz4//scaffold22_size323478//47140//48651//NITZ4_000505-RA/size323478-processed-gene-0.385-mRNA-1//1//CDS//3329542929//5470//frame0